MGQLTRNFTDQGIALGQVVLQDAKWHMVTLTTLWDGTPGYAMMIDGQLAAVLNGNYTYTGELDAQHMITRPLMESAQLTGISLNLVTQNSGPW